MGVTNASKSKGLVSIIHELYIRIFDTQFGVLNFLFILQQLEPLFQVIQTVIFEEQISSL